MTLTAFAGVGIGPQLVHRRTAPGVLGSLAAQLGRCQHSSCTPARAAKVEEACTAASCIQGKSYRVSKQDRLLFHEKGYAVSLSEYVYAHEAMRLSTRTPVHR